MTADTDLVIRSISPEMREILLCLQDYLPLPVDAMVGKSIDVFHPNPKSARRILSDCRNLPHETIINIGSEILNVKIDAVFDERRRYLGPSVCWEVITEKFRQKQKIVLVDRADNIRARLQNLLLENRDIEIIGSATDIREARGLILDAKPDVVILDIKASDHKGFEILRELKKRLPDIRFAILSNYPYFIYQKGNDEYGVCCFINKTTELQRVPEIIRKIKAYCR